MAILNSIPFLYAKWGNIFPPRQENLLFLQDKTGEKVHPPIEFQDGVNSPSKQK